MSTLEDIIAEQFPDWDTDGFGDDSCLICPHGDTIEQDGTCPQGCVSPLIQLGMM